jgi:hypothetical protein
MNQIDYDYYEWLISQIDIPNNNRTYNDLFDLMHHSEFVWTVPKDDNRVQDGLDLRTEFRNYFFNKPRGKLLLGGPTMLEILVSLSRRVAFIAGSDAPHWAWRLIKNLRLNKMHDELTKERATKVDEILYAIIWREYQPNGRGGFFPLTWPKEDQTKVEIWYQMQAYVNEMREH